MLEAMLVVFTKPRVGREDDFNTWYSNIHIRDALRFRGSVATQRFKFAPSQVQAFATPYEWGYLALYEVADAERFTQEHIDNALTKRMDISDAIDDTVLDDYHFYPLQFRDNAPLSGKPGGVIMEQMNVAAGQEAAFEVWYNEHYLPIAVKREGVRSAAFLVFRPTAQLLPTQPTHTYVAIYRTTGPQAVAAWKQSNELRNCPLIDKASLLITCWDPITERLTKDAVLHPRSDALAAEERARIQIGDRIIKDRGNLRTH